LAGRNKKKLWFGGSIAGLVLVVGFGMAWADSLEDLLKRRPRRYDKPRRIVLVTLDTMHVGYLGPYNPSVDFTPNLDRLAAEGVRFEAAYTPVPLTLPAHTTLFTGLSPMTHGVMLNGDNASERLTTLAEILSEDGFRTAAFVSLGVMKAGFGLEQGFDYYSDDFSHLGRWYKRADEIVGDAQRWIFDNKEDRFFVWLHLSDPHEPYVSIDDPPDSELLLDGELLGRWNLKRKEMNRIILELSPGRHELEWRSLRPPEERGRGLQLTLLETEALESVSVDAVPSGDQEEQPLVPSFLLRLESSSPGVQRVPIAFRGRLARGRQAEVLEQYRLEVEYMDLHIGRLSRFLEDLNLGEETLWVVLSDHGEGLYGNGGLGHSTQVFEDQLRIAWIMKGPGIPRNLVVSSEPARTEDVLPTLLEYLGLESSTASEGLSRVSCLRWRGCPPTEPWWSYGARQNGSVTAVAGYDWPFKAIWRKSLKQRAYKLDEDRGETRNLLREGEPPSEIRRLRQQLERQTEVFQKGIEDRAALEMSPQRIDLLRSLGYLN